MFLSSILFSSETQQLKLCLPWIIIMARLSHLCFSYSAHGSKKKSWNLTSWENFCGGNSDIQWHLNPAHFLLLGKFFLSWIELRVSILSHSTKSSTVSKTFCGLEPCFMPDFALFTYSPQYTSCWLLRYIFNCTCLNQDLLSTSCWQTKQLYIQSTNILSWCQGGQSCSYNVFARPRA